MLSREFSLSIDQTNDNLFEASSVSRLQPCFSLKNTNYSARTLWTWKGMSLSSWLESHVRFELTKNAWKAFMLPLHQWDIVLAVTDASATAVSTYPYAGGRSAKSSLSYCHFKCSGTLWRCDEPRCSWYKFNAAVILSALSRTLFAASHESLTFLGTTFLGSQ